MVARTPKNCPVVAKWEEGDGTGRSKQPLVLDDGDRVVFEVGAAPAGTRSVRSSEPPTEDTRMLARRAAGISPRVTTTAPRSDPATIPEGRFVGPDFLVLGTQKAGTAWLHRNLGAHPDIWMTPEKELHYFDERIDGSPPLLLRAIGRDPRARRWRRQARRQYRHVRRDAHDPGWRWHARLLLGADHRIGWYRRMFAPAAGRLAGEATPNYAVLSPDRIRRVHADFPHLRLVLLVRHPVERLWSQALMVRRLHEEDAVSTPGEMLDYPDARAFGRYGALLDNWATVFGPERIWVGFMEDVAMRPREVLNGVTDHLGVTRHDRYPMAKRVVHLGGGPDLPVHVARDLARALVDDVDAALARLGGPARWWAWSTRRLAEGSLGLGDLALPLWSSRLWDDWVATGEVDSPSPTLASGRLDRLPVTTG